MQEGKLKAFLYKTHIIPLYSKFSNYIYDCKVKRRWNPDRWYYKFMPIKKNKIVFDSYLGKGYNDNPKAIAEEIIRQGLDYDLVWMTNKPEQMPPEIRQVKYGSREAMKELATAKFWIFNVRTVFHPKKRKGQKYLHTWHAGYVVKLIEKQAENKIGEGYSTSAKADGAITDAVISSSDFLSKIYKNNFWLNKNAEILEIGTPKNDVLFDEVKKVELNEKIRNKYSLAKDTKIVLYFPTFRADFTLDHYDLDYKKIIDAFEKKYDGKYSILVRFHPNVANIANEHHLSESLLGKVINVTDYPEACELYTIADAMISDYSGVMLAFALQKKPIFIYAPDLDNYLEERGFNEVFDMIPCRKCINNDELVEEILNFDDVVFQKELNTMFSYIKPFETGNASKAVVKWLKNN